MTDVLGAEAAAAVEIAYTLNSTPREAKVEARRLLAHHLRDDCGLTGTHIGCDTSQCGIPAHRLRVVAPDVGGGFGAKLPAYREDVIVTLAEPEVITAAAKASVRDLAPISDNAASGEYRLHLTSIACQRALNRAALRPPPPPARTP